MYLKNREGEVFWVDVYAAQDIEDFRKYIHAAVDMFTQNMHKLGRSEKGRVFLKDKTPGHWHNLFKQWCEDNENTGVEE